MSIFEKRWSTIALGVGIVFLAACTSSPILDARPAGFPDGVDLSGGWKARVSPNARLLPGQRAGAAPIVRKRSSRRGPGPPAGSSVEIFLEFGESLKISQTMFGLFISFDRSVVEEYTFGENRRVTVGPIEAQRVSGWDGESFVIETIDAGGTLLTESWRSRSDGECLYRTIRISKGDQELFSAEQEFTRVK